MNTRESAFIDGLVSGLKDREDIEELYISDTGKGMMYKLKGDNNYLVVMAFETDSIPTDARPVVYN